MIENIKKWIIENKKAVAFIVKMLVIYLGLQLFYDYILTPYTQVDFWLINLSIRC